MKIIRHYLNLFSTLLSSRTARNTYYVFFGNFLSAVLAFVFTVILFRILSKSDFGYYSALFSILLLLSDVSDIGIGTSLSRFLPPLKDNRSEQNSFLLTSFIYQLFIVTLLSIILFVLSPVIAEKVFHSQSYAYLVKILSLGIITLGICGYTVNALSAREHFIGSAIISASSSIMRVIFILLLIVLSLVTLSHVLWAQILSFLLTAIFGIFLLDPRFFLSTPSKVNLIRLVRFSFFLGISRSFTAISSRLDTIMLLALTNSIETATYATASRVISIYPLLAGSFSMVIAPRFSSMKHRSELKPFMKKVILATAGLIGTILIMIIVAHPFMVLLFGQKASDSVPVFQLLLVSMIFFVASVPAVSIVIYYIKMPYILTINSIIQLAIVAFGNLLFIPLFGRFGPIYSLILAYGITLVLTTYLCYRKLKTYHEL